MIAASARLPEGHRTLPPLRLVAANPESGREEALKELKYDASECLEPRSVRAWVARAGGLEACTADGFGIDMPVFDETIDQINSVANELAARVSEASGTRESELETQGPDQLRKILRTKARAGSSKAATSS